MCHNLLLNLYSNGTGSMIKVQYVSVSGVHTLMAGRVKGEKVTCFKREKQLGQCVAPF